MSPQANTGTRAAEPTTLGRRRRDAVAQPVAATLSLIVLAALIIFLISPALYFERWDHEIGDQVPHSLRAPFTLTVIDEAERTRLLADARNSVPRIYVMDVAAADGVLARVERIFEAIDESYPAGEVVPDFEDMDAGSEAELRDLGQALTAEVGANLSDATLLTLVRNRSNEQFRQEIAGAFRYLLRERGIEINNRADTLIALNDANEVEIVFQGGLPPTTFDEQDLTHVLNRHEAGEEGVNQYLRHHSVLRHQDEREALREVVAALIVGNIWPDEEETARRQEGAVAAVSSDLYGTRYERNQLIAAEGAQITREQWLALRAVERQKPFYLMLNFMGNSALVLCLLLFLTLYPKRFGRDWSYTTANVNVLGLPLVLVLLVARIVMLALPHEEIAGYLFPAGALGMMGAILIGPRVGLLQLFVGCILFAFMNQMNFQYMMVGVVGGAAAVSALITLRRRRDILRAGLIAGIANALAILTIRFIDNPALMVFRDWSIVSLMGWGVVNGLACSMITLISLVVFEYLFRVTTDLNLIELTSIKTPLLRELEEKTPGTYQHTLNVSKLAEAAAEAIDANYLLVRAGAHYHDIGKMVKPKYFTENQATAEERRIHTKLAPSLSALIIKEHVKKGIDLARAHRLPEKVIDFIPQHHGTSLIKYFHTEAQRRFAMGETSDPVQESEFRYPGPRPQTVETAILMLADSVEATATAKCTGSVVKRDDIERIVRDTIREKFIDGQLDECNLTLADLDRIRESFVNSLLARYHQRIDYPAASAAARGA